MSIVHLTIKQQQQQQQQRQQKKALNIPVSRMQRKVQFFKQQYKCLILWYFTYSQL